MAGAIGNILALVAESVFKLNIRLSLEVFHFSGVSLRGTAHEHARAVRVRLLAAIGIAREMIAGGGVAERPLRRRSPSSTSSSSPHRRPSGAGCERLGSLLPKRFHGQLWDGTMLPTVFVSPPGGLCAIDESTSGPNIVSAPIMTVPALDTRMDRVGMLYLRFEREGN